MIARSSPSGSVILIATQKRKSPIVQSSIVVLHSVRFLFYPVAHVLRPSDCARCSYAIPGLVVIWGSSPLGYRGHGEVFSTAEKYVQGLHQLDHWQEFILGPTVP